MSKLSTTLAMLGAVSALGVAALPLSSYAVDQPSVSKSAQVTVGVEGAISISFVAPSSTAGDTDGSVFTPATGVLKLANAKVNGAPVIGTMGVQVATNNTTGYTLTAKSSATTDMVGSGSAETFSIPANANVAQGTAGWAIKGGDLSENKAIDASGVQLKKTDEAPKGTPEVDNKNFENTDVIFTVAADSSTREGTYTGTVIFTAAVND